MISQRLYDKLVFLGVAGFGVLIIKEGVSIWLKKICYHKIGTVSGLKIYPLKGAKGIEIEEGLVSFQGLESNGVQDRSFVVYRPDLGEFRSSCFSETRKIGKINVKIMSSRSIKIWSDDDEIGVTVAPTEIMLDKLMVSGVHAENL